MENDMDLRPSAALLAATAIALPLAGAPARAQSVDLDRIYETGRSAVAFIEDRDVYGANGEDIGEVEDLVVASDGSIQSVVVETDGFYGIGERIISIPLERVEGGMIGGEPAVRVPLRADEVTGLSAAFDDLASVFSTETTEPRPSLWRVSRQVGSIVRTTVPDPDERAIAYVDDFVIEGGEISGVVIIPAGPVGFEGKRVLPYDGVAEGWDPAAGTYRVPYTIAEIAEMPRLDYGRLIR